MSQGFPIEILWDLNHVEAVKTKKQREQIEAHLLEQGRSGRQALARRFASVICCHSRWPIWKRSMPRKLTGAQMMGIVDSFECGQGPPKRSYKNRKRTHGISSISW